MADTGLAGRAGSNGHSANGGARTAAERPSGKAPDRDAGSGGGVRSLVGRALRGVAAQAQRRIPRADLDERDPDFIRERLPLMWLFANLWYRGEVRGLGNIPDEGPVLMVGNHSGGNMTPDTVVFTLAFNTFFGVERPFYQLAHNLVFSMPGLGALRKFGTVAASPRNARQALRAGAALLVYPGGDYEAHRPSWQRNRVDFDGRQGFIRLALDEGVPIVPVVSIGGQETALFLSRGEGLARLLALNRMFRLKVLPISLSLPWIVNVGDMLGHIPLPAKLTIETLPPIDLEAEFGPDPDLDEIYDHLIRLMQDTLDALAAERRFPVIG
jgi:1-acyl-sn-glycerol-3-phosphate acyltransferase